MAEGGIYDRLKEEIRRFQLDVNYLYKNLSEIGLKPRINLSEKLDELRQFYTEHYHDVLITRNHDTIEIYRRFERFSFDIKEENRRLLGLKRQYNTLRYTDCLSKLEQTCINAETISEEDRKVISHYLTLKRKEANPLEGNAFVNAFINVEDRFKADYLILTQADSADENTEIDGTFQKRLEGELPIFINAFPEEYKAKYMEILRAAKRNGYRYGPLYSLARTIPEHFTSGKEDIYLDNFLKKIEIER
jgi:hypothetical protein